MVSSNDAFANQSLTQSLNDSLSSFGLKPRTQVSMKSQATPSDRSRTSSTVHSPKTTPDPFSFGNFETSSHVTTGLPNTAQNRTAQSSAPPSGFGGTSSDFLDMDFSFPSSESSGSVAGGTSTSGLESLLDAVSLSGTSTRGTAVSSPLKGPEVPATQAAAWQTISSVDILGDLLSPTAVSVPSATSTSSSMNSLGTGNVVGNSDSTASGDIFGLSKRDVSAAADAAEALLSMSSPPPVSSAANDDLLGFGDFHASPAAPVSSFTSAHPMESGNSQGSAIPDLLGPTADFTPSNTPASNPSGAASVSPSNAASINLLDPEPGTDLDILNAFYTGPAPATGNGSAGSTLDDILFGVKPPLPSQNSPSQTSTSQGGVQLPAQNSFQHPVKSSPLVDDLGISWEVDEGCSINVDVDLDEGGAEGDSEYRIQLRRKRLAERKSKMQAKVIELRTREAEERNAQDLRQSLDDQYGAKIDAWHNRNKGNIRALLGSMDTVLWEGASWTAISMTKLISPAEVKKAYHKALLHIHPDRVKNKNGTVTQIYIADKIFDSLKDAWGKFEATENP